MSNRSGPWATGRKNWLFAGTLMAGQRAAAVMSLIQSAKLNGHDPYAYMKDVLITFWAAQRAHAPGSPIPMLEILPSSMPRTTSTATPRGTLSPATGGRCNSAAIHAPSGADVSSGTGSP